MMRQNISLIGVSLIICLNVAEQRTASANPYPDPNAVPVSDLTVIDRPRMQLPIKTTDLDTQAVLRVTVAWSQDLDKVQDNTSGRFTIVEQKVENSGTQGLALRSQSKPELGSFVGSIEWHDQFGQKHVLYDSTGTGHLFKFLNREISFRFPLTQFSKVGQLPFGTRFVLTAEHSVSGEMQEVLNQVLISQLGIYHEYQGNKKSIISLDPLVEVRELKSAETSPAIQMVIYSEGYLAGEKADFFEKANRVPNTFEADSFPEWKRIRVLAVFRPSLKKLGKAVDLGMPIPEFGTWLGLYYPYWMPFGRWYNVTYPTREQKLRDGVAVVPYDYPIVLTNSSDYWGVGNYKTYTALPAKSPYFSYLLLHEFGHFLGLNEEYDGGGRTELEFAPQIQEPWSQNLTFLRDPKKLKWRDLLQASVPIPTPESYWNSTQPVFGAYEGGYGDSEPIRESFRPGLHCTMEDGKKFCPICTRAMKQVILKDLGAF